MRRLADAHFQGAEIGRCVIDSSEFGRGGNHEARRQVCVQVVLLLVSCLDGVRGRLRVCEPLPLYSRHWVGSLAIHKTFQILRHVLEERVIHALGCGWALLRIVFEHFLQ